MPLFCQPVVRIATGAGGIANGGGLAIAGVSVNATPDTLQDNSYIDNLVHGELLAAGRLGPDDTASGKAYFLTDYAPQNTFAFFRRRLLTQLYRREWLELQWATVDLRAVHPDTTPNAHAHGPTRIGTGHRGGCVYGRMAYEPHRAQREQRTTCAAARLHG